MRATYQWLARLIAVGVVLQAAFIAYGMFDISSSVRDGRAFTADSEATAGMTLHGAFGGIVIPLLVLLLLIVSFFSKIPGGVRLALVVLGLVLLQGMLGFVSFAAPALGLLHGINAFALAGVAGLAGRRAGQAAGPAPASRAETAAAA